MERAVADFSEHAKEIPEELRHVLVSLGRGLGTVAVYGDGHPSVEQIIDKTFEDLQDALTNRRLITIGTFNGTLTVDEEPVLTRDVPVRTLEKRLVAMRVSHLVLTKGLTRNELKKLLTVLCSPNDKQLKETFSGSGFDHVRMEDVKYVALRDGEQKAGKGSGGENSRGSDAGDGNAAQVKVSQIVAFLKGEASGDAAGEVKKILSDPERLGQMIMEAAAVRQVMDSACDGESLADIVIGCLRRTYSGLRKEAEFQTTHGKANLTKAMMLLEKNVLDKIHAALGAQHPEIDRRIFDAIREMEEEQQFEMLTAHYFDQRRKLEKVEENLIQNIQRQGAEKARKQIGDLDIPLKDWQRLMVKAGVETAPNNGSMNGAGSGIDISALAVVLEMIEGLMQLDGADMTQIKTAVTATRNGLNTYADRIELRIHELEGQIEPGARSAQTVEDHAGHLSREKLMEEVSKLTLSLLQPLTVVNASIEASMRHAEKEVQIDLLDLAYESGKRMQSLTRRLMTLVGYPVLGK
ncbi:MAG: hypothetical protein HOO88_04625 [Kiritimatiellaceae bacterium]|nr:hypothetical protein [Kiritimatiellaceae bacterium]